MRRLIEPTLVRQFMVRASAGPLVALSGCLAQEEAARAAGDRRRAIRLSGEFHLRIADGAGHQTLARVLRELVSRTSLVLMTYGSKEALAAAPGCGCHEHRTLLAAIRLRDAKEAARLMVDHLTHVEAQLRFELPPTDEVDFGQIFGGARSGEGGR